MGLFRGNAMDHDRDSRNRLGCGPAWGGAAALVLARQSGDGQDHRAVGRDRDGVLGVGGAAAVGAADRPAVVVEVDARRLPPARNHGSIAMTRPGTSRRPRPALPSVGDVRVLVHGPADAVTAEVGGDAVARRRGRPAPMAAEMSPSLPPGTGGGDARRQGRLGRRRSARASAVGGRPDGEGDRRRRRPSRPGSRRRPR